jgi:predicted Rossmann-fold nucleotide-binding protein
MAWRLARLGYVIASGGGPGAMEASNLGAYMFERSVEEVDEALKLLASTCDPAVENEYQVRISFIPM